MTGAVESESRSLQGEAVLVVAVLTVSTVLGISSLWNDGPTYDEPQYLMAGYAYLSEGRFDINPEHPPFWKELAVAPLLFAGLGPPPLDPWGPDNPVSAETLFRVPRLVIFGMFLVTALFVYGWSWELWGSRGAVLSLLLYAFCPNLLAFGRLLTPDFPIASLWLVTLYTFWRYCRKATAPRFLLCAGVLGLALASRFSAILLIPSFGLVLAWLALTGDKAVPMAQTDAASAPRKWAAVLLLPLALLAASVPVVALTYGFIGFPHYFTGFARFFEHATGSGHHAYLLGRYSRDGWWWYFLVAIVLKTPLPALIALAGTAVMGRRSGRKAGEAFLWLPAGLFLLAASMNRVNLGIRLVLPIYPLAFVAMGRLATLDVFRKRPVKFLAGVLALWYVTGCFRTYPHYLSYFNEIVGPDRGYHHLSDSNVDWGQDLPRLAVYLNERRASGVLLAYYGLAPAQYYGIQCQVLPTGDARKDTLAWRSSEGYFHEQRPRLLAISVTLLKGVPFDDHSVYGWLEDRKPEVTVGRSIRVYDTTGDPEASRSLIRLYEACTAPEDERLREEFEMFGPPKLAEQERQLLQRLVGQGDR
jgi:hypothetical protein